MAIRADDAYSWSTEEASGTAKYVPNLFSKMFIKEYYKRAVLTEICNTNADSSGIVKQGDVVTFRSLPSITINDMAVNGAVSYERMAGASTIDLVIDRAKSFSFKLDDIDMTQTDLKGILQPAFIEHARKTMDVAIATEFLADMVDEGHASNLGLTAGVISASINLGTHAAPLTLTKSNVLDFFSNCKLVLNEQEVNGTGRYIVIPSTVASLIERSDLDSADYSGMGEALRLKDGFIGSICGFKIFESNCAPVDSSKEYDIVFGQKDAVCYVNQLNKVETLRLEGYFSDAVRALTVFDWKCVQTKALGNAVAKVQL